MPDLNILAILAATVLSYVIGGAYYVQLIKQLATVTRTAVPGQRPKPWQFAADVPRHLVPVIVVAGLAAKLGADDWTDGLLLALALWAAFPVVVWTGVLIHERRPFKYVAIHMGDWLLRLPVIAIIVSVWN
jgi:Protein of unknown function (DUF1761)